MALLFSSFEITFGRGRVWERASKIIRKMLINLTIGGYWTDTRDELDTRDR